MSKVSRSSSSAIILAAFLAVAAAAQKLPDGAHHRNRERTYDIQHYRAELDFDFDRRGVSGRSTVRLEPLRPTATIVFDAVGLEVTGVTRDGSALEFETTGTELRIALGGEAAAGETVTLDVDYRATPRAGMYFQRDRGNPGLYFVHTYGEGGLHANWMPVYGDPNDKFTSEMVVAVPKPYAVVSNGRLVGTDDRGGEVVYHWSQERPHPGYLISIYVGDFEKGELPPAFGDVPLSYWVPRGRLADGAYAFRNTPRMVEFFSDRFGYRYPWIKYDQIAIPDYAIGAMEHTGVTGLNSSVLRPPEGAPLDFGGPTFSEYTTDWTAEATISHELAHHWFGDNLTCRELSFIWLNESFASYMMMLWDEESVGREQLVFDADLARRHYFAYVDEEHLIRPLEYHYFDSPDDIYNTEHTYLKGAAVLHMLRHVLGDDGFFGALGAYLKKHEFGNVISTDLKIAIEEHTGLNLDWFFAQWVTGGGHPIFEIDARYRADRKVLDLQIAQVQPLVEGQGLFRLPIEVTVATAAETWTRTVWVEKATEHVLLPSAEKPLMVSVDGDGDLVAEIRFEKPLTELVYQLQNDALGGRLRALRQLAARFPHRQQTLEAFRAVLTGDAFWGLSAEAAELLGEIRGDGALALVDLALGSSDYRVRKAAVLALPRFAVGEAEARLRRIVAEDPASDVVGTALVALAKANPEVDAEIFEKQLMRDAWWDEIKIACLEAIEALERPELAAIARRYAGDGYNQDVRTAALAAWEASAPDDAELHRVLLASLEEPPYPVQKHAIEALGRLAVREAAPVLEELIASAVDPTFTDLAREALEEIQRVNGD